MLNGFAKIYNITPKKDSKRQQQLKDIQKDTIYVTCAECGEKHTTLYKVGEQYYCKEHKNRVVT